MTASSWRPLLAGADARESRSVARAIRARTAAPAGDTEPRPLGIAQGAAGAALVQAYLMADGGGDGRDVTRFLDQAIEGVNKGYERLDLYGGAPGIGWVADHLDRNFLGEEPDAECELDELILASLSRPARLGDYDLISGLVGLGLAALEGLHRPRARSCLATAVEKLGDVSEETDDGITWFTPPELLPDSQLSVSPNGHFNLGVAHGVPGVIGLLAYAVEARVEERRARSLLEGAVTWLFAQQPPPESDSRFSYCVGQGVANKGARVAWCYGDLGIAVVLLNAARRCGRADWEEDALRIAERTTMRNGKSDGVVDAGLCHGAAGNAHLYNRLYQATGRRLFAEAARAGYRRLLEMRRPGQGVCGYSALMAGNDTDVVWRSDPGFLTGAGGVALALQAAVSSTEPCWDRLLMVDVPLAS